MGQGLRRHGRGERREGVNSGRKHKEAWAVDIGGRAREEAGRRGDGGKCEWMEQCLEAWERVEHV